MNRNMNEKTNLLDWQRGNESKTKPYERVELMNLWLKSNKEALIKKINESQKNDDEENIVGFVDV